MTCHRQFSELVLYDNGINEIEIQLNYTLKAFGVFKNKQESV